MSLDTLNRDLFRAAVFGRDSYKCVVCRQPAADAHHIIERRLWNDGGYYTDNGASLCPVHHIEAEQTLLTCTQIREAAGIKRVLLPDHLYADIEYDKWTNIIHPDGTRSPGELFRDESVQKVLRAGDVLRLFRPYIKYPRTLHLPWSPGHTDDDRVMSNEGVEGYFGGEEIVITEKLDGENTSIYSDYVHARSLDSGAHPSRGWVKSLQAEIGWQLGPGMRLCGENLFAKHTLAYDDLPGYFMLFSVWDNRNYCLSWDDTVEWAQLLGLCTVPVIWRGVCRSGAHLQLLMRDRLNLDRQEGYVVRLARDFAYGAFRQSVAKYVRAAHIGTSHNWMMQAVVKNGLREITKQR